MILIIKHVKQEGPGVISPFLKKRGFKLKTIELEKGEKLPLSLRGIEAIIVMGGPMSVYDQMQYPFLESETLFLKEIIKKKIPALGICLGAQMLAKAAGARVNLGTCREVGWSEVTLTKEAGNDPLFKGLNRKIPVFQWHSDVFELPPRAVLLANSKKCPNQAARITKNVYAIQFHLEVTQKMIEDWCREDAQTGGFLKEEEAAKIMKQTPDKIGLLKRNIKILLSNFSQLISK